MAQIRIDKFLSHAGICSRSKVRQFLKAHSVSFRGVRLTRTHDHIDTAEPVTIDGEQIGDLPHEYLLLNKPMNVISTTEDPLGRTSVITLVQSTRPVFPVGRLDKDTTGLIILTSDGHLTHALIHPDSHVPRTYILTIKGIPLEGAMRRFRKGLLLEDGATLPTSLTLQKTYEDQGETFSLLRATLYEGRNRQIRRMCDMLGWDLIHLHRIAIGPIQDDGLASGEWRPLTQDELHLLQEAINTKSQGLQSQSE
jgi:23S rRNA pseudouridine2605 synthase